MGWGRCPCPESRRVGADDLAASSQGLGAASDFGYGHARNGPECVQAVTAHIVAESPQVKAALENHSGDLRQALREAGLHLDRISVTVQSMDASAQAGTATSGGHHGGNQGGADQGRAAAAFGEAPPDQKTGTLDGTGMSGVSGNGMPSFAAHAGSQGGRQGGQPPAYAAAYAPAEPEREEGSLLGASRQTASGQVDIRA